MKIQTGSFALLTVLAASALFGLQSARAQLTNGGQILRVADSHGYRLLHTASTTYRFSSKTGLTQRLVIASLSGTGKNMKYSWLPVTEPGTAAVGDAGRYDVVEGQGDGASLVRLDTSTGRSWAMIAATIPYWKEISIN